MCKKVAQLCKIATYIYYVITCLEKHINLSNMIKERKKLISILKIHISKNK